MPGVSFSQQVKKEMGVITSKMSEAVTSAAKESWKVAVENTPVETGLLRHSWKLSRDRRSSYIPKPGKRPKPSVPDFSFRITKDKRVYLFNNVPYASYVENGEGPGERTPSHALLKAKIKFSSELDKRLKRIR